MFAVGDTVLLDTSRWDIPGIQPLMEGTITAALPESTFHVTLPGYRGIFVAPVNELHLPESAKAPTDDELRVQLEKALTRVDELAAERDDLLDRLEIADEDDHA